MMKTTPTMQLFSLENLPTDPDTLQALHDAVHDAVGDTTVALTKEVEEHFRKTKQLRDSLIDEAEDDPKSAAPAVSAINAFTNVLIKISELQLRTASQEAFQALLSSVINVLAEEGMDVRRRVVAAWRKELEEMI